MSYYPEGIMLKKGAYNYPEKYIDFDEFISLMESDELKEQIDKLRTYEYKSSNYNNAKRRLPVVLFNKFKMSSAWSFISLTSSFLVNLCSSIPAFSQSPKAIIVAVKSSILISFFFM